MNIHTPSDHVLVKPSLDPEVRTADANGLGVDCRGFEKALVICHLGVHNRADGDEEINFKLEESDDNVTFTAVTGGETGAIGDVTPNATAGKVYLIDVNLSKRKRYLRVVADVSGTTPSDACSAMIALFNPRNAEVSQESAVAQVL